MQAPVVLALRWSPALRAALVFMHLLPVFVVCSAGVSVFLCGGVSAVAAVSALWSWHAARQARFRHIVLHASGDAELLEARVASAPILVRSTSVDLGWLVVLHWLPFSGGRTQRTVLCRDAYPVEDWRALRRWVRWQSDRSDSAKPTRRSSV